MTRPHIFTETRVYVDEDPDPWIVTGHYPKGNLELVRERADQGATESYRGTKRVVHESRVHLAE